MKSSVAFYNFGAVGQNNTDNYVSGYDYIDRVVPLARFLDNRSLFAVSDDRIMFFGGAQKPMGWSLAAGRAAADTVWMCTINRGTLSAPLHMI